MEEEYVYGYATGIDIDGKNHKFEVDSEGFLCCSDNHLTSLDLSNCPNLDNLNCQYNQLNILDLSNCKNLKELYCHGNQLNGLDLSNCPNLKYIFCHNNYLNNLDVSNCQNLKYLYCNNIIDVDSFKHIKDVYLFIE